MNELERMEQLHRGKAILEGKNNQIRQDGYVNMLNKYGTKQDNSTHYQWESDNIVDDLTIERMYETNGLFAKIIDRPAEECMKHGLDLSDLGDKEEAINGKLDQLDAEAVIIKAEKWARLFGGALVVMLVDDGRGLEEPLDWKNVKSIDELRVYDRSIIQPDYSALYSYYNDRDGVPFGQPEWYDVFSIYGTFRVHYTRCLIFKNGELPERTEAAIYRFWGIPEYNKIKEALRQTVTTHENGPKLLERSVQAIYKMKNLSQTLATDEGEDKVVQRLAVIDMARGILNSVAIDGDGEDYSYINGQMSGVKDIIDSTCNMLSAVTDIPQTILFGRSPAGENATGRADLENYYNMVERIQTSNLKKNLRKLVHLVLIELKKNNTIDGDIPDFDIRFQPLWSMSETEQVQVDQMKAGIDQVKAATAQVYVDMQALDPSEVRKALSKSEDYDIQDIIDEDDLEFPDDAFAQQQATTQNQADKEPLLRESNKPTPNGETSPYEANNDVTDDISSIQIIVTKYGRILVGQKGDQVSVIAGTILDDERPEECVIRSMYDEFGIFPKDLTYIGNGVYLCTDFEGTPQANEDDVTKLRWLSIEKLADEDVDDNTENAINQLLYALQYKYTFTNDDDYVSITLGDRGNKNSGNYKHAGREGKVGGSAPTGTDIENNPKIKKILDAGNINLKKNDNDIAYSRIKDGKKVVEKNLATQKEHASASVNDRTFEKFPELQGEYDKIVANEAEISNDMEKLSNEIGTELYGLEYSLKSASSLERKIEKKLTTRRTDPKDVIKGIGDVVRYTQITPLDNLVDATNSTISNLKKKGYNITEVDNRFKNEGYKGIHINAVSPKGQAFEMQIHTPESMAAKEASHPIYEIAREKDCPDEIKARMNNITAKIFNPVHAPTNINKIKNYKKEE